VAKAGAVTPIRIKAAPEPTGFTRGRSDGRFRSTDAMPYASNDDLPVPIRRHLPEHAQDIFREAFNNAWRTYGAREPGRREEIAHRVAWAAVKKRYRKVGDDWVAFEG
jgi:cation transport regulator